MFGKCGGLSIFYFLICLAKYYTLIIWRFNIETKKLLKRITKEKCNNTYFMDIVFKYKFFVGLMLINFFIIVKVTEIYSKSMTPKEVIIKISVAENNKDFNTYISLFSKNARLKMINEFYGDINDLKNFFYETASKNKGKFPNIISVNVVGDTAVVTYEPPLPEENGDIKIFSKSASLVKENGIWKVEEVVIPGSIKTTSSSTLLLMLAETNKMAGDYQEAFSYYQQAINANPYNAEVYFKAAITYCEVGNNNTCILYMKKAINLEPANNEYIIKLGNYFYYLHKYADAITYYKKALDIIDINDDSKRAELYVYGAYCYEGLGKFEYAIVWLDRAYEINKNYLINLHQAKLYIILDKNDIAIKKIEKAKWISNNNDEAQIEIKQFVEDLQIEFIEFNNYYIKYLKQANPDIEKNLIDEAIKLIEDGDCDNAYKKIEIYIDSNTIETDDDDIIPIINVISENDDEAYFYKGKILLGSCGDYMKDDYDKYGYMYMVELAINYLKKAIEINSLNAEYYFKLGNTYTQYYDRFTGSSRPESCEAIKNYEKAIQLDTEKGEYYFSLGREYSVSYGHFKEDNEHSDCINLKNAENKIKEYFQKACNLGFKNGCSALKGDWNSIFLN